MEYMNGVHKVTLAKHGLHKADGFPFSPAGDVNFIPLHNHYFHFSPGMHRDATQCVNMTVLDDGVVKDDEELYAVLSTDDPSVGLKEPYRAVITIINSNCEFINGRLFIIMMMFFLSFPDVSVSLKDSIYYTTKATGYTQICALLMEGVLGKIMHMSLAINNTGNGRCCHLKQTQETKCIIFLIIIIYISNYSF